MDLTPPPPSSPSPVRSEPLSALRLYVIRHGKAERNSATGEDEDRKLKPRGERQAKFIGEKLANEKRAPKVLLHSPVLRADQSAKAIAAVAGCNHSEAPALATDEPVRGIAALIEQNRHHGVLAIVGHNPTLESLCVLLAPAQLKGKGIELRTGECIVIDIPESKPLTAGAMIARWRLDDEGD